MKTLLEEYLIDPGISDEIKGWFRETTVVKADNVAEYLWINEDDKPTLSPNDFPNLAPPLKNIFIEWYEPPGKIFEWIIQFQKRVQKKLKPSDFHHKTGLLFRVIDEKKGDEIRWTVRVDLFSDKSFGLPPLIYKVTKDGQLYLKNEGDVFDNVDVIQDEIDGERKLESQEYGWETRVGFLTISLMHCKNVKIIPRGGGIGKKPNKRNRHEPKFRYHVLDIEPMKTVLRLEGEGEKMGLKHALHICRGHFKDYRNGKGLFGKFNDLIWWSDHVRGSIANGIVSKDYRILLDDDKPGENDEIHG